MNKIRFVILLLCFSYATSLHAQTKAYNEAMNYLNTRGEVSFYFINRDHALSLLTRTVSIDAVHGDTIYAYANAKEFKNFLQFGLPYQVLTPPTPLSDRTKSGSVQDWNVYPTYDQYVSLMDSFANARPDICKLVEIGTSVQGRKLLFVKISDNVNDKEAEPEFMYSSSMHGNELTGYVLMLHLIDYLLKNYDTDTTVSKLVNNLEIWINPLANPDGTYNSGNSTISGATRYNYNGYDLNRNFPDPQDGLNPGGTWQVETIAMMDFMKVHNFTLSANFHGGDEVVNYPWDTWYKRHPDDSWYQLVSKEYADTIKKYGGSSYFSSISSSGITDGYDWYTISGGRQDYMNYYRHAREVTIEISTTKMPSATSMPTYWSYNYKAFLNYMQQCLFGIHGIVTNSQTQAPVKAFVEVLSHDADSSQIYSDSTNGDYHRLIYPGTYTLRFSAPGYVAKEISDVVVASRSKTILNVELDPDTNVSLNEQVALVSDVRFYPNPLNSESKLYVIVQRQTCIKVTLNDACGRQISTLANENFSAGEYSFAITKNISPGIYFCRILADGKLYKTIKLVKF